MIKLLNITKTYGEADTRVDALRGISLNVEDGGFCAIMGQSGSGKSTLLNILGCLDVQSSGKYLLNGMEVKNLSSAKKAWVRNTSIGFVFQSFFLLPGLTCEQNIELPLIYRGDSLKKRQELVESMLNALGLYERRHHMSNQLSGGQCQRVAIGRALICKPKIVLADEPTGNLDTKTGEEIMQLFVDLNKQDTTIVLITHEHEIAEYAKKTYTLKDGLLYQISGEQS